MRNVWIALVASAGCVVVVERGNGDIVTEVREVGAFDAVRSAVWIPVEVTLGDTERVAVTCDSNLVDRFTTEVVGGELRIARSHRFTDPFDSSSGCRVTVETADLTGVSATASGDVTVDGEATALERAGATGSGDLVVHAAVEGVRLDASATGSGEVSLDRVDVDDLSLSTTGSGDLTVVAGTADTLDVWVSGSGDVLARGVIAADVTVTVSGSGGAEVTATDRLDASTSGSGGVDVWGDPDERQTASTGSGEVTFRE